MFKSSQIGEFIMKWGSEGEGNGQLSKPESSIVDSQGNVYVADYGNDRIHKFTNDLQVQLQVLEYDLCTSSHVMKVLYFLLLP